LGEVLNLDVKAFAVPRAGWAEAFEQFGIPKGHTGPAEEMFEAVNAGWMDLGVEGTEHVAGTTSARDVFAAAQKAVTAWTATFTPWRSRSNMKVLGAAGLAAKETRALASYVLSSLEGAIVLSRAEKRVAPLERTASFVVQTVRGRLSERWSSLVVRDHSSISYEIRYYKDGLVYKAVL
jgi:hypothetical protein